MVLQLIVLLHIWYLRSCWKPWNCLWVKVALLHMHSRPASFTYPYNVLSRLTMNHFSCTQKSQYGSHFVHTMRQRSLLCDIIGAWISNQEQRHVSKSALKAANGSRTTLIDCNYKTRLKTQKRPKKTKMKKRNGGLALPRNPSQLSNTNQYSSGILVYVCCI
jgi:hypothetical protein